MLFRDLLHFFSFGWNAYALISFAAALTMWSFGLFLFLWYRRGPGHVFHILTVVCLAIWGTAEGLQRFSATPETFLWWWHVGSVGWIFMLPFFVHFTLLLTGNTAGRMPLVAALLYSPAFVFLVLSAQTNLFVDAGTITKDAWGWHSGLTPFIAKIFVPWLWLLIVTALVVLARVARRVKEHAVRRRLLAAILGLLFPVLFGSLMQVVLPLLGIPGPPLSSAMMPLVVIATYFAVVRFRLFSITPAVALSATLDSIQDIVIVVNTDLQIQFVNRAVGPMFSRTGAELVGTQFEALFSPTTNHWKLFSADIVQKLTKGRMVAHHETALVGRAGREVPVSISASPIIIRDAGTVPIGYVFVIRDIREIQNILQELELRSHELEAVKRRLAERLGIVPA